MENADVWGWMMHVDAYGLGEGNVMEYLMNE